PVLFEWDYNSQTHVKDVSTWKLFLPTNPVVAAYAQAINKGAPHPAAARLWEEYLYSNAGQNEFLRGGAHPVRMAAMTAAGSVGGQGWPEPLLYHRSEPGVPPERLFQ